VWHGIAFNESAGIKPTATLILWQTAFYSTCAQEKSHFGHIPAYPNTLKYRMLVKFEYENHIAATPGDLAQLQLPQDMQSKICKANTPSDPSATPNQFNRNPFDIRRIRLMGSLIRNLGRSDEK